MQSLQILMNKAARHVTGYTAFTPIRRLLLKCRWLSVKQQVFYQTVIMTHKTKITKSPYHMWKKMGTGYPYRTRQSTSVCIRLDETFSCSSSLTQKGFKYRGATNYNQIPADIRSKVNMATFKSKLKRWVINNLPID